jgi:hypothetical protein
MQSSFRLGRWGLRGVILPGTPRFTHEVAAADYSACHSGLMPDALITFAHFSVSIAMKASNPAGV